MHSECVVAENLCLCRPQQLIYTARNRYNCMCHTWRGYIEFVLSMRNTFTHGAADLDKSSAVLRLVQALLAFTGEIGTSLVLLRQHCSWQGL